MDCYTLLAVYLVCGVYVREDCDDEILSFTVPFLLSVCMYLHFFSPYLSVVV